MTPRQDFRSENGLYSLIQAQFDAAAKQASKKPDAETRDDSAEDEDDADRPGKRRRTSRDASPEKEDADEQTQDEASQEQIKRELQPVSDANALPETVTLPEIKQASAPSYVTPRQTRHALSIAQLTTSPLSSPLPDDQIVPPSAFRFGHLSAFGVPPSSSPLSSPPPVLFDPYESGSTSDADSSEQSGASDSESEEFSAARKLFASSQGSNTGRSNLPNMKGRDLFDVSVWADPVRTSVFYTFATSLRQKIKDAEPTGSHRFISHLRNRGKLVRCYTQNIDQIEEKVGLSTSLIDGPGSRGRFSRRSTANKDQLSQMVEEARDSEPPSSQSSATEPSSSESTTPPASQASVDGISSSQTDTESSSAETKKTAQPPALKKEPSSGVECVFLHGSLELLRCFLCGQVCSWDEEDREMATMTGQQPECPRCAGAAAEREEKGKRALGVGKLRPDIVLYGEEHPNAHLISPIITHDLALYPDMLLILGTSLRVHGLKVMVREFAKTVHSKGGKVVFVNFTKPPESSWGDIIDFWIQWDCDAWVDDLQVRVPKLWRDPSPKKPRGPAANPVAMRDSKVTGAYCTLKILKELRRITGKESPVPAARRATIIGGIAPSLDTTAIDAPPNPVFKLPRPRAKGPRKSAPGALEKPKKRPSTLNPNHGRSRKSDVAQVVGEVQPLERQSPPPSDPIDENSILSSVKSNPRVRKRKMIDGEEVVMPTVKSRASPQNKQDPGMTLAPLRPGLVSPSPFAKPQPLEIRSPPTGPLASLSPNVRAVNAFRRPNPFYIDDPLVGLLEHPLTVKMVQPQPAQKPSQRGRRTVKASIENDAAAALADLGTSPLLRKATAQRALAPRALEGQLRNWGSSWSCNR